MTSLELLIEPIVNRKNLLTTCNFSVLLNGRTVWPVEGVHGGAIEIQIDDLLSHLVEFWKPLLLRQTYPLCFNPPRPSDLRAYAQARWGDLPESQAEDEDEEIEKFRQCHDISRCFAGYYDLPELWFIRSSDEFHIDTGKKFYRISFSEGFAALEKAGDFIASRLKNSSSKRWDKLIHAWGKRNLGDSFRLLRLSTGLDELTLRFAAEKGLLALPESVIDAANENDELRIAARMSSALPREDVQNILTRLGAIPLGGGEEIATAAKDIREYIHKGHGNERPYMQGLIIAAKMRDMFFDGSEGAIDILGLFRQLGVTIYIEDLNIPSLDALAIWGRRHGPAVVLNSGSPRHKGSGDITEHGTVRITLAHELCHFLIDGEHALGAVEVLQSKMPVAIERRARAFAPEFLLPTFIAGQFWQQFGSRTDQEGVLTLLNHLCYTFKVSRSVASWKIQYAAREHGYNLEKILDAIVPQRKPPQIPSD
jgi:hypothetical protein